MSLVVKPRPVCVDVSSCSNGVMWSKKMFMFCVSRVFSASSIMVLRSIVSGGVTDSCCEVAVSGGNSSECGIRAVVSDGKAGECVIRVVV